MEERENRLFPDDGDKSKITCFSMAADFLIYGNEVSRSFYQFCNSLKIWQLKLYRAIE